MKFVSQEPRTAAPLPGAMAEQTSLWVIPVTLAAHVWSMPTQLPPIPPHHWHLLGFVVQLEQNLVCEQLTARMDAHVNAQRNTDERLRQGANRRSGGGGGGVTLRCSAQALASLGLSLQSAQVPFL
jgi:hypothetical protein